MQQFNEKLVKELAARLLAKVIKRTPVCEDYNKPVNFTTQDGKNVSFTPHTGKVGGTLRRGWTSKTEDEAESRNDNGDKTKSYLSSIEVKKAGNTYQITILNPVSYASYVEYGHRTNAKNKNSKLWVDGSFMLTISEQELNSNKDAIIERKIEEYVRKCFNV